MEGFIEGVNRGRTKLFPGRLKDLIGEEHVVGVADLFVEKLDLLGLGVPSRTITLTLGDLPFSWQDRS